MKNILITSLLLLAPLAHAIPGGCYIEITQRGDVLNYQIEGMKTSDFSEFTQFLEKLAKLGETTKNDPSMPTGELSFRINIDGIVDLDVILSIKKILTPYGFDHYTIESEPNKDTHIVITMGSPIKGDQVSRPTLKKCPSAIKLKKEANQESRLYGDNAPF